MAVLLAICVMAGSAPCLAADVQAEEMQTDTYTGLDAEYHTQEEIREYYQSHPIRNMEAEFVTEPSVTEPYALGELTEETKQDALNMLNLYRYIAGVPTVPITDTAQDYAQAAALVCAVNTELSHGAICPEGMDDEIADLAVYGAANSNLAAGGSVLSDTIVRLMQDTMDANGNEDFGHRRQLLDYYYTEAGFGLAKSKIGLYYSAAFVDANLREDKVISYPGQNQPLEYFGTEYAWTVIVPEKVDASAIHVKLTDMKSGKIWNYSQESENFRLDISQNSTCVIFIPDHIGYKDGERYKVEITGIGTPISYEVNMFLLNDPVPLESLSSSIRTYYPYEGESGYVCAVDYIPENATNKIVTWSSSDPDIAEPMWNGTGLCRVAAKKPGTAIFTATSDEGGHTVTIEIVVRPKAEKLTLNASDITIGVGQYFELKGTVFPEESKDSVYFKTDYDKNIISCEETGYGNRIKITGKAVGETSVLAYAHSDHAVTAACDIHVVEPVYTTDLRFEENQIELMEGDSVPLILLASPENITCRELEWSSSNSNIIKAEQGKATACGTGTAVVTAKALDGSEKEAQCTFTVYGKFEKIGELRVESVTDTSVVLQQIQGCEYSRDLTNWQDSNKFTSLEPEHEYTFYIRRKASGYMKASDASDGTVVKTLSSVGSVSNPIERKMISNNHVILSQTSYTYDGTAKMPTITVKDGAAVLREGTDYTVAYSNNVNAGTAKVTVTGKGNYEGTVTKNFTITVKKGSVHTVGSYQYKVSGTSTASVTGGKNNKITKVKVPKTVKIGGKAFKVTAIASRAFRNNKKITSVGIGDNVKLIGPSAFEGCTKLSKATVGKGVTEIGGSAFKGCKKLGTITIKSAKLKKVGKNALKGIKATAKIKVPAKKLSAYKKLFKSKGQGKKVKIVK